MPAPSPETNAEDYLRLLNQHERLLAAYVHSLVPSTADADDILQEAKIVLWRRFSEFEQDTNFMAWARRIALNLILNFRRSHRRRTTSPIEEEFVRSVAHEIDRRSDHFERRSEAPQRCLKKLPRPHRQAIFWRYYEDCSVGEIAERTNRTVGATYRLLSRIRQLLNDCVTRTLRTEAI